MHTTHFGRIGARGRRVFLRQAAVSSASGRLGRMLILAALLLGGLAAAAQAGHGGPAWEHDDPARRVYGGGP